MMKDIYVVVVENDGGDPEKGRLVFEQYEETGTIKNAIDRADQLRGKYGKCWLGIVKIIGEIE